MFLQLQTHSKTASQSQKKNITESLNHKQ